MNVTSRQSRPQDESAGPTKAQQRADRIARRFDIPMVIIALLALPTMIIQGSNLGSVWQTAAAIVDWMIWLAFAFELTVMLAVVPDRKRWLFTHPLEVIIVVLTPPVLPDPLQSVRLLRLLVLARLLFAAGRVRYVFSTEVLRYAALGTLIVVVGGGTALAAVEPQQRLSDWDGVWWAIETVTTVGYGDIYPVTTVGRIIGILVMVCGVGFLALLTGTLAQHFVQGTHSESKDQPNPRLEGKLEDVLDKLDKVSRELSDLRAAMRRDDPEDSDRNR